ncbi:hypothetical protein [Streptomyces sp. NPDC005244]|uniref:hypothetical protein n=1 Tax=Streptomyces sp. NPDC005244 TaxID=3364708 RepID=UPI0036C42802
MTKSHGRKSRARKTSRRQGAGFAAANAGTLHVHDSGPSSTDLQPTDSSLWGAESVPDLRAAAALIGACIEQCAPCWRSLTAKLLDADPVVLAVTAGAVFALHASRDVDAQDFAAQPARVFFQLVDRARAAGDDFRVLRESVKQMPLADRAQLLGEALDLWASYGRQYPDLIRGENLARAPFGSDTLVTGALSSRNAGRDPKRKRPGHSGCSGSPGEGRIDCAEPLLTVVDSTMWHGCGMRRVTDILEGAWCLRLRSPPDLPGEPVPRQRVRRFDTYSAPNNQNPINAQNMTMNTSELNHESPLPKCRRSVAATPPTSTRTSFLVPSRPMPIKIPAKEAEEEWA